MSLKFFNINKRLFKGISGLAEPLKNSQIKGKLDNYIFTKWNTILGYLVFQKCKFLIDNSIHTVGKISSFVLIKFWYRMLAVHSVSLK